MEGKADLDDIRGRFELWGNGGGPEGIRRFFAPEDGKDGCK